MHPSLSPNPNPDPSPSPTPNPNQVGSRRFGLLASINRRIAAWGNTFVADTPLSDGHEGGYNVTRLWSTGFPLPQVGSVLTMAILTMAIVLTMATLVVGRTYCVCALPIAAGGAPERACHRPRAG